MLMRNKRVFREVFYSAFRNVSGMKRTIYLNPLFGDGKRQTEMIYQGTQVSVRFIISQLQMQNHTLAGMEDLAVLSTLGITALIRSRYGLVRLVPSKQKD